MTYRVIVNTPAVADAETIRENAATRVSPEYAERELLLIEKAIDSLVDFPKRYTLAPEAHTHRKEVRQLVVGNYRILFMVIMETVNVLRIRHTAQAALKPGELN